MSSSTSAARKQPYWTPITQGWASNILESSHVDALYMFGEWALFTMFWRVQDETAGLVGRCPSCYAGSREAQAFGQPERKKCPDCYGTSFEGGFRAQIVRPALFADRNIETTDTEHGTVISDAIHVETTGDFAMKAGDLVVRYDGTRFKVEEKDESILRTGFSPPVEVSYSGNIPLAHLDDPTSPSFLVPPTSASALRALLTPPNTHLVPDLSTQETIRPNGYL